MTDFPELPFDWPADWLIPTYERKDAIFLMRQLACRIVSDEHRFCTYVKREPNRERQIEALAVWKAANFLELFFKDRSDR
jgi:hypothetical protein